MPKAHSYGFLPGFRDRRDRKFGVARTALPLPPRMDLVPECPPAFDQTSQNSCVANAIIAAVQFDRMKQGLKWRDLSRRFVYWNTRRMEVTTDSDAGCQIRDAVKMVNQTGICDEVLCPYDDSLVFDEPEIEAYNRADEHAVAYERLDDPSLSPVAHLALMKACLSEGIPFVLGIAIYESFESDEVTKSGIVPMPKEQEGLMGWHAVMACGYNDSDDGGRFTVQNSWSANWGQKGRFTIPYAFLSNPDLAMDVWAIRSVD